MGPLVVPGDRREDGLYAMWLTRFSIQRPIIVAMFFIALAAFGTISYLQLGKNS